MKNIKLIETPKQEIFDAALDELQKFNAITITTKKKVQTIDVTDLGKRMSDFPVDPAYARC